MNSDMELTEQERMRYARHISLPGFGEEAQLKLKSGSVLVIGAGGLGSPVLLYLAAAGVGRIGVADSDCVDLSNLQRQVIHSTDSVGTPKVDSAALRLRALNPEVVVETHRLIVDESNIERLIGEYDFVIEASDSLELKFIVDAACVRLGKPYNHGAIWRYEGQTMTILPGTPSLLSLFPDGAGGVERDAAIGPLGVVPGILGTIQAAEAIKYLTGKGDLLTGRLLRFDVLSMNFQTVSLG